MPSTAPTRLAGHEHALHKLLDALLAEVPSVDDTDDTIADDAAPAAAAKLPPLNATAGRPIPEQAVGKRTPADLAPAWARPRFRALLFRVGEFRFAMPLVLMHSVSVLPHRLARVPGQPDWHRGIARHRGRAVVVADIGELLGLHTRCRAAQYLLAIGDGGAALVCDRIEDASTVDVDAVRWRDPAAGRAWLAGLLVGEMCALLNPDAVSGKIRHG